jgi:hypothetical protein
MHKFKTFQRFLLGMAVLVCCAHTASAAPLASITSASTFCSEKTCGINLLGASVSNEGTANVAKKLSDVASSYAGDMQSFAADNVGANPPASPEPSSLALLGTSVFCIAGVGRRLLL